MDLTYEDVKRDLKNEFLKQFPSLRVFDNNTFISIFLNVVAFGVYYTHDSMKWLLKQVFAHTANLDHLKLQATNRIEYLKATKSSGLVVISGDVDTTISKGEIFTLVNSDLDVSLLDDTTIEEVSYTYGYFNYISAYETILTINFKHYINLVEGMSITIEDANIDAFNGTWKIKRIVDNKTIEVKIDDSSLLNEDLDNTNITIKVNIAIGLVESVNTGSINNLPPFSNLDSTNTDIEVVGVNYNGLTGGRDDETDNQYRERYLKFLREPQSFFNEKWIIYKILDNFPKVTRVNINSTPDKVYIYLINANSTDLKVDDNTIEDIREYLLDTYKPINLDPFKIYTVNPDQKRINITISNISPSANNSFKELIYNEVYNYIISLDVGGTLKLDFLKGFIYNLRDYENNYYVDNFEISLDSDIDIDDGYILVPNIEVI